MTTAAWIVLLAPLAGCLLIAAVGAVILARRRSGLEDPREISVADVMRGSGGTRIDAPKESMLEAGGPANR